MYIWFSIPVLTNNLSFQLSRAKFRATFFKKHMLVAYPQADLLTEETQLHETLFGLTVQSQESAK